MGLFRSKEEKQQIASARSMLLAASAGLRGQPEEVRAIANQIRNDPSLSALKAKERSQQFDTIFRQYADVVLADDVLTQDEESAFVELAQALGAYQEGFQPEYQEIMYRLFIARVNDGRLVPVPEPRLMVKKDEEVYLETDAALLKEVAVREYRSGSRGVSFRIAKGVSYRVGATRGQSVVVGTRLDTTDLGVLSVTSHRAVFLGSKRSIEHAYGKLLDLEVYTDGIRLHVSNRQTPTFLGVDSGDAVAAALNAAVQRFEG